MCLIPPIKNYLDSIIVRKSKIYEDMCGCPNSEAVASMILGIPPGNEENLFAAQIITGIYDVDKLDYMLRESYFTRLPLPLDEERLIYKYHVRKIKAKEICYKNIRNAK